MNKALFYILPMFLLGILDILAFNQAFGADLSATSRDRYQKPQNFSSINSSRSIVKQPNVDLALYPGAHLQPDGTFLFKVPELDEVIYKYERILGSNANNTVKLDGRLIIHYLDLKGGNNTLHILEGSELTFDPRYPYMKTLEFVNISNFIIEQGAKLDLLKSKYNTFDHTITFNSQDSQDENNIITIKALSLYGDESNLKGYININNAKVDITGGAILTNHDETINLKSASLTSEGQVNDKTVSTLILKEGLSNPGGSNTLNMGKYSNIIMPQGKGIQFGGIDNSMNMDVGASIQGAVVFKGINTTINILGAKDYGPNDRNNTSVDAITLGGGLNTVNVAPDAKFKIKSYLVSGEGVTKIFMGDSAVLSVGDTASNLGEIALLGGNGNYLELGEQAELNARFTYGGATSFNRVVINTGSSYVTLNGSLQGSSNNDSLILLGQGNFNVTCDSEGCGIDRFTNLNLGTARINFYKNFYQTIDSNVILGVAPGVVEETEPRLWFHKLGRFADNTLNVTYKGVSKYLNQVGDLYTLTFIRNGDVDAKQLHDLSSIGIKDINFKSAIYNFNYTIENDSDLKFTLHKYQTFREALTSPSSTELDKYVAHMGGFLDNLLGVTNLPDKYYDMLDDLSMLGLSDLRRALAGYLPINSTVLFNINQNFIDNLKTINIDKATYKIVRNDISLWSNISFAKVNVTDTQSISGAHAKSQIYSVGAEYSPTSFFKLGVNAGYSKPDIDSNNGFYNGYSEQFYYGLYNTINFNNHFVTNVSFGLSQSNYKLSREPLYFNTIHSNPKFTHTDIDLSLLYKYKLQRYMITPFVSARYTHAVMGSYMEEGIIRKIKANHLNELKTGIGVKGLVIQQIPFMDIVFIPNFTLGIYNSIQSKCSTEVETDIGFPIRFYHNTRYGGWTAQARASATLVIQNFFTLEAYSGASLGNQHNAYNVGITATFLL